MGIFFSKNDYKKFGNDKNKLLLYDELNNKIIELTNKLNIYGEEINKLKNMNENYNNILIKNDTNYSKIYKELNELNNNNINNSKIIRTLNVIVNNNEKDLNYLKDNVENLKKKEEFNSVYTETNTFVSNINESID